jgi:hypothetical protein
MDNAKGSMMNERIRELAKESGLLVHNPTGVPTKLDKFAELIVRECAHLVDTLNEAYGEPSTAGKFIKEQFGVKE